MDLRAPILCATDLQTSGPRATDVAVALARKVGTHGRRGLTRVLLGSTAERCLRHSSVPVLVARRAELGRG